MRFSSDEHKTRKIGLALSGGGFRATLFHVGVLAQLAEFGKLREVETISTVSGGSIVGMVYYLHLKKFLETNNRQMVDDDYLKVVKKVERDVLEIVLKGFRHSTLGLGGIHKQYIITGNKLSEKLDRLYESILSINNSPSLNEMVINPLFKGNKPPQIIVNATSLNTGEKWKFTSEGTSQMKKYIRQIWHSPWSKHYDDSDYLSQFTIGKAVAASAAVPAFIKPISIRKGKVNIELIDGGILDNLGATSLLEENCNHLIISNGSKYLENKLAPSSSLSNVILRTQDIFMNTIVENNLKDVDIDLVNIDMRSFPKYSPINDTNKNESYQGVKIILQHYLSNVRTDLDSFSENEAKSIMFLGFMFALWQFNAWNSLNNISCTLIKPNEAWQFKTIEGKFNNPDNEFLKEIKVGKHRFYRSIRKKFVKLD